MQSGDEFQSICYFYPSTGDVHRNKKVARGWQQLQIEDLVQWLCYDPELGSIVHS
jgi:hypothetical protein